MVGIMVLEVRGQHPSDEGCKTSNYLCPPTDAQSTHEIGDGDA